MESASRTTDSTKVPVKAVSCRLDCLLSCQYHSKAFVLMLTKYSILALNARTVNRAYWSQVQRFKVQVRRIKLLALLNMLRSLHSILRTLTPTVHNMIHSLPINSVLVRDTNTSWWARNSFLVRPTHNVCRSHHQTTPTTSSRLLFHRSPCLDRVTPRRSSLGVQLERLWSNRHVDNRRDVLRGIRAQTDIFQSLGVVENLAQKKQPQSAGFGARTVGLEIGPFGGNALFELGNSRLVTRLDGQIVRREKRVVQRPFHPFT